MPRDLWGFKNEKDLEKTVVDLPETILKEQIAKLGDKTNYVLYGKPEFLKIDYEDFEYKMATIFYIVVPALDNYKKILLIMYSNPEEEYPVAITVEQELAREDVFFSPDYTCHNTEEFVTTIQKILSSEETMKIIRMLYSKASMLAQ